jgi:amino acid transporter
LLNSGTTFLTHHFNLYIAKQQSALVPLSGGIIRHAEYFVDPALSFANGWNQVYSNMVAIPAELVAAAVILEFWAEVNNAIWIVVFGFLILVSNLCFIVVYGELEFVFALLKIMLIVGLNIMAGLPFYLLSPHSSMDSKSNS